MNHFVLCNKNAVEDILEWSKRKRDASTHWFLFDKVLYDLCQQYPRHDNAHEVVAKIAIIGRAYSASVERRKNAETTSDRDFYYGYVAPLIVDSDLDKRLDALRKYQTPTTENLPEILATHLYLQELLKKATEMNKRSFASKYLHFHCPNLFYIFDSYSDREINRLVKSKGKWSCPSDADACYAKYCEKSLFIQQQTVPHERNFPRILDSYLQVRARVRHHRGVRQQEGLIPTGKGKRLVFKETPNKARLSALHAIYLQALFCECHFESECRDCLQHCKCSVISN